MYLNPFGVPFFFAVKLLSCHFSISKSNLSKIVSETLKGGGRDRRRGLGTHFP